MVRPNPASLAPDPHAPARALIGDQLAMLSRLAEIGMEIAEIAGRQAAANADNAAAAHLDPALSYARAARAVRMTIALQSRLMKDLDALDRADGAALAARASTRRQRTHHIIERAIEAEHEDKDEIDDLSSDAWERLVDQDDADLADRPMAEIVAAICSDLGLSPDETAWALEAAAGSLFPRSDGRGADPPWPGLMRSGRTSTPLSPRSRASPAPMVAAGPDLTG